VQDQEFFIHFGSGQLSKERHFGICYGQEQLYDTSVMNDAEIAILRKNSMTVRCIFVIVQEQLHYICFDAETALMLQF